MAIFRRKIYQRDIIAFFSEVGAGDCQIPLYSKFSYSQVPGGDGGMGVGGKTTISVGGIRLYSGSSYNRE